MGLAATKCVRRAKEDHKPMFAGPGTAGAMAVLQRNPAHPDTGMTTAVAGLREEVVQKRNARTR
ncbi:hypothetical protein ACM41_31970 [Bradyrhizobium sp. CCBAU 21362]|jgi:hypothetical protein|nr:hypothetical protein [Bradyrhizobium sp. CCBAU 21362]